MKVSSQKRTNTRNGQPLSVNVAASSTFVNLSRMDYELVCNILKLLDETGLDDEELSFLFGKRNKYFSLM